MKGGASFGPRGEEKTSRVLSQAVNVRSEPRAHADLSSASLS